jgi:tetratricopeptide (TPR) repeat protein
VSYRDVNTPAGKIVDLIRGVKITAGQDVVADIDMSRAAFIAKLPADQRKALEDLKKQNSSAIEANKTIGSINADLKVATQDIKDAEAARTQAATELGASASIDAINAKVEEIKTAKYTEIVTLMTKDTAAMSDQSILWTDLGRGELGLKNYDDAETHFKKAVTVETASKKPKQDLIAVSDAGLGEVYARQGKIPEATAAYDDAVKADPSRAGLNLRNEAIIYFQLGNAAAQIAAADKAIAVDPTAPIPYYIKGQGLIQSATVDAKTQRIVLPPGCEEAYKKYLELAPKGQYAAEVQSILDQAAKPISVNKRGR